ncbi:hypothetical protein ACKA06_00530 [Rossellomorea oryzaecorticis]|uniref:Uncharacterized protein n=1 Tax=Rossellomorea oryzaecorticis TaxID=1396505 RepID=A0ABW8VIL2_9BACI
MIQAQSAVSEPGSEHLSGAWLKSPGLFQAQLTLIVPGTKHTICSWHKTTYLCLAPHPGTAPKITLTYLT